MQNRREHPRAALGITAEIEVDGTVWHGQTRDISEGGISGEVEGALQDGQRVSVTLILTQDGIEDPNEEPFETLATVMWCAETERKRCMFGLRFTDLNQANQLRIRRFLKACAL